MSGSASEEEPLFEEVKPDFTFDCGCQIYDQQMVNGMLGYTRALCVGCHEGMKAYADELDAPAA